MASPTRTRRGLQGIAQDTLDQTSSIIQEHVHEGATGDSSFHAEQLPSLSPLPSTENKTKYPVEIINGDSFAVARRLLDEHPDAKGSIAVLNLASDEEPGGGWLISLSKTQVGFDTSVLGPGYCFIDVLWLFRKKRSATRLLSI